MIYSKLTPTVVGKAVQEALLICRSIRSCKLIEQLALLKPFIEEYESKYLVNAFVASDVDRIYNENISAYSKILKDIYALTGEKLFTEVENENVEVNRDIAQLYQQANLN